MNRRTLRAGVAAKGVCAEMKAGSAENLFPLLSTGEAVKPLPEFLTHLKLVVESRAPLTEGPGT